jgi:hypothetical protein
LATEGCVPVTQNQVSEVVVREVNGKDAVAGSGMERYWLTAEALAEVILVSFVVDAAIGLHFADDSAGWIFNRRQRFREGTRTRVIATGRHLHKQSFVRSLQVIDLTPLIEGVLGVL